MRWFFAIGALSPMLLVATSPLARRQSSTDTFSLYAYGDNIGAFPILYSDGLAYVGEKPSLNSSLQVPYFTESSKTFIANPNTTESSNATWSQQRLAVPPAASNGQVSFVSNTSSDVVTSGFFLYGHVLLLSTSSGDIQSLFGAQATDTDGVWKLVWNSTSTDGSIVPLTLKSTAPPTS